MTTLEFWAKAVVSSFEDDTHTVAFADSDRHPKQYVILQKSDVFDEQDRALHLDTYYVEICGQDTSFYGGIVECVLSEDQLKLALDAAKNRTSLAQIIVLRDVEKQVWANVRDGLERIFDGTNVRVRAEQRGTA
jgi:hypothetical protein